MVATPRTLTIRFPREHPGPIAGDVMRSTGDTWYLVHHVHRVKHRVPGSTQAWRLTCVVIDYLPLDTIIHPFEWDRRGRVRPGR